MEEIRKRQNSKLDFFTRNNGIHRSFFNFMIVYYNFVFIPFSLLILKSPDFKHIFKFNTQHYDPLH